MPGWCRLDEAYLHNPKIRRLGYPANLIFVAVILEAKQHGRGGVLSLDHWDPEHLADLVRCPDPGVIETAMKVLEQAGVVQVGDELTVSHWSRYQLDPSGAARQRAHRAKKKAEALTDGDGESQAITGRNSYGTQRSVSNGCNDDGTGRDRTERAARPRSIYDKDKDLAALAATHSSEEDDEAFGSLGPRARPVAELVARLWPDFELAHAHQVVVAVVRYLDGIDEIGRAHV